MHIELAHVSKHFGQVVALDDVSFSARSGEVTCLLGDNGAGKSTVIRILSGVHMPTTGSYRIDDASTQLRSPREALERGIATVHQDIGLIPLLSIWRNFFLGLEPTRGAGPWRRIDVPACRAATREALAAMGITVRDPDEPVAVLSGGERQSIAIARAIHRGAQTLILDEPTAALGVKQAGIVLRNITNARERGVAVIFVTHNPQHAYSVGDHFVVLEQGRVTGRFSRGEVSPGQLSELMSGEHR
jgi:simple sugar transport system ATP-binding protein